VATFNAYFLAGFFSFVALFYLVRLHTQPMPRQFMGKPGSSHWIGHAAFRFFRVLILFVCILRVFMPETDNYLLICHFLYQPVTLIIGAGLMVSGFVFTVIGHYTLGEFWSSGIPLNRMNTLVTKGVYAFSRNPMFIGVLTTQFGFFIALPSVFTFICLIVGFTAIFNQVRIEEQHLSEMINEEYSSYQRHVPRWI